MRLSFGLVAFNKTPTTRLDGKFNSGAITGPRSHIGWTDFIEISNILDPSNVNEKLRETVQVGNNYHDLFYLLSLLAGHKQWGEEVEEKLIVYFLVNLRIYLAGGKCCFTR